MVTYIYIHRLSVLTPLSQLLLMVAWTWHPSIVSAACAGISAPIWSMTSARTAATALTKVCKMGKSANDDYFFKRLGLSKPHSLEFHPSNAKTCSCKCRICNNNSIFIDLKKDINAKDRYGMWQAKRLPSIGNRCKCLHQCSWIQLNQSKSHVVSKNLSW